MTDTIDPEKLEADIAALEKWFARYAYLHDVSPEGIQRVLEAARATLAMLPRWKDIEVAQWVAVDRSGEVHGVWDHESQARDSIGLDDRFSIIRLTGTAKVKVQG